MNTFAKYLNLFVNDFGVALAVMTALIFILGIVNAIFMLAWIAVM